MGGWVGPRTGLDHVEKINISPLPGLELRTLCRRSNNETRFISNSFRDNYTKWICVQYECERARMFPTLLFCKQQVMSGHMCNVG
jgi:hypothetical protein